MREDDMVTEDIPHRDFEFQAVSSDSTQVSQAEARREFILLGLNPANAYPEVDKVEIITYQDL